MGQYWIPVNLDKREYIHPHKLGTGLKLWEQVANHPGTGAALLMLTAAMPETRGGGDLRLEDEASRKIIGRWAGDRIAIVGDYAEDSDLPEEFEASTIYNLCSSEEEIGEVIEHWEKCEWSDEPEVKATYAERAERLRESGPYTDISEAVCAVIETELDGKYSGEGWRSFKYNH